MDERPSIKLSQQPGKKSRQFVQGYMGQPVHQRRHIEEIPTIPMSPHPQKKRGRRRRPHPVIIALVAFLLIIVSGGGTLAYLYYTRVHEPLNQFIRPVPRDSGESDTYASISGRAWNILLLGSDNDGKYTFPTVLTQVMMIVHVDPINNKVTMVSIPRDSWVRVPEVGGMHKVSQAFFLGASGSNKFEDGVRLARLTVEQDYGVTIDRYGWVGLDGFAKVIDTLGGIDIDVTHPMVDDSYPNDTGKSADPHDPYAYKRVYIAPGPQHLDGQEALEYVRTRHGDLVGDIGRTQRQQQVLQALKRKLTVNSIIENMPQIFKDLQGDVYTDLSEQEMIDFANFGRTLNANAISQVTLGPGKGDQNYGEYSSVFDPTTNSQQDVIIPHCDVITPTINRIFGLGNLASCNVTGP